MPDKVTKSDDEWRRDLTPEEFEVIRNRGTEAPFSGDLVDKKDDGTYACKACGAELFSSQAKYDSASGWPSFFEAINSGAIDTAVDKSQGMERTEIICRRCGAHLGHVFDDGPEKMPDGSKATGKRYCVNSIALDFNEKDG